MRAALRRRTEPAPFRLGEPAIHHEQRRATVGERHVEPTATELERLRVLSVDGYRMPDPGDP